MSSTATARGRRIVLAPTRADLVDAAFLIALCGLALIGFRSVYTGSTYLVVGMTGVVLGVAIGHLANALRQPLITVAVMAIAVFFLLGGALALRSQVGAGPLPTPTTLRGLASISVHGWKDLLTTLPPVDGTGPLLAIPYILGLIGGAGGFTMARRLRFAAAPVLAPAAVLAAVILLGTSKPAAQLLQGAVFGVVALAWCALRALRLRPAVQNGSGRASRLVTALALVGVAGLVAVVAGPHAPGSDNHRVVLRYHVTPPPVTSNYPSPLVGFRRYTQDADNDYPQTLFTVKGTTLPTGSYIRIATLDDYTGTVWAATNAADTSQSGSATATDAFLRVGSQIASDAKGEAATLQITIGDPYAKIPEDSAWLPTVGSLTSITFDGTDKASDAASFRYNLATTAGIVTTGLQPGDQYTLHTIISTETMPANAQPYGTPTLDPSTYGFATAQATQWSKGATGTVAEVLADATHLLHTGAYSDGGPGEGEYLPGHSEARLKTFLSGQQPVGDDEQYAATLALMSNALGLPARVVLGAVPEADGSVKGKDVHAWVEVHISDGSWVSISNKQFMPDQSVKPNQQPPDQLQQAAAAVVPPPNAVHAPTTQDQETRTDSNSTHQTHHAAVARAWHLPGYLVNALEWGGPPLVIIALLCGLIVGLKARRRHRRRTRGPASVRVSRGWRELVDQARDLGASLASGQTRREQGHALDELGIAHLAVDADAAIFGPGDPAEDAARQYWVRVDAARRSMKKGVGRWGRWRAALSLRSLRALPTGDESGSR